MKKIRVAALLLLMILGAQAHADEASHRQSAEQLLKAMGLQETTMAGVNAMFDVQLQLNPMLLPYRDVFQQWAQSFLTWDAIGQQLTDLYAATFTEQELREMTAFYASPTGRKAREKMGDLAREGAEIGMKLAREHQSELQEMIRQRAQELQRVAPGGESGTAPEPVTPQAGAQRPGEQRSAE